MSDATGLGLLDVAILEACEAVGATHDRPFVKTRLVLDEVYARTGIGPGVVSEPLYDLTRPWVVHHRLLDVHGNVGSPDFGPADPRYTECRLTPLGAEALAAERGDRSPLPIGLVNGDVHAGGRRPPFDPGRVADAIARANELTDDEIVAAVGAPAFPMGCSVEGDLGALARGERVDLVVTARIDDDGDRDDAIMITGLVPGVSTGEVAGDIQSMVGELGPAELGISDVSDRGSTSDLVRLVVGLRPGADRDAVRARLLGLWSLRQSLEAQLPEPLATTIRRFVTA